MSSKLKLKSTAGGSLSLIVDDTLATDETMNISDGGIVTVTNANGTAIKYPDGTMICTLDYTATGITPTTVAVQGLTQYTHAYSWIFPHAFIDTTTVVSANPRLKNSGTPVASMNTTYCTEPSVSSTTVAFLSLAGFNEVQNGGFIAIGRWK